MTDEDIIFSSFSSIINARSIKEVGIELCEENKKLKKECEELKKTVLTKCPNCNSEYLTPKGIELYEENRKLEQKCCELTVENEKLRSSLSNSLIFRFAIQAIKSNVKYDQALDEIEKKCCAVLNGDEKILHAYQIKDIINKAKDGQ